MADDDSTPLSYNGGAVVAMVGKGCVAIATDKRYGSEVQLISTNCPKVFQMGPMLFIGLPGFLMDAQAVYRRLKFRLNLYELKENRLMSPKTLTFMTSNLLYERKFGPYILHPVIAGLDPRTFEPYISSLDILGCLNSPEDFVVAGSCCPQLYGMCEALWEPNLPPEELFEAISQALVNATDRDALSGFGAVVHVIEKDKVTERTIKTRMD